MRKRLLLFACLLAGAIAGYLLMSSRARPVPLSEAPAKSTANLREKRDRLLSRRDELLALRADRKRWAEALREPVRTVAQTGDAESGSVRIRVGDPGGAPLSGQELRLSSLGGRYSEEVKTNESGAVTIEGVPPGRLYVSLSTSGGHRSFDADVTAGALTEILVPSPRGRATVVGTVEERERGPLAGVHLSLSMRLGIYSDSLRSETGEDGRFVFEAVPPGPWTLRAYGGPLGKKRRPTAEIAVLKEGEVRVDLVAGIESISGTVRDVPSGTPLPGVLVRVDRSGSDHQSQTTDENGRYRFLDLSPAKWEVEAILEGHVRWHSGPVPIGPGEAKSLDIPMEPAAEVLAVVLDADGRPVTGRVGLSFVVPGERWPSGSTVQLASERGEVRYRELPPGEYKVRALSFKSEKRGMTVHTFAVGQVNRVEIRLAR